MSLCIINIACTYMYTDACTYICTCKFIHTRLSARAHPGCSHARKSVREKSTFCATPSALSSRGSASCLKILQRMAGEYTACVHREWLAKCVSCVFRVCIMCVCLTCILGMRALWLSTQSAVLRMCLSQLWVPHAQLPSQSCVQSGSLANFCAVWQTDLSTFV